jgi:hypothetical protein
VNVRDAVPSMWSWSLYGWSTVHPFLNAAAVGRAVCSARLVR